MTGAIRWKDAEGLVQEEEEEDAGCTRGDGQMLMGRERGGEEGGRWLPKMFKVLPLQNGWEVSIDWK